MQSKKDAEFWSRKLLARERKHIEVFLSFHELVDNGYMVMAAMQKIQQDLKVSIVTISKIRKELPAKLMQIIKRHPDLQDRATRYMDSTMQASAQ